MQRKVRPCQAIWLAMGNNRLDQLKHDKMLPPLVMNITSCSMIHHFSIQYIIEASMSHSFNNLIPEKRLLEL